MIKNQKGQTSIEYVLMIAAIVAIMSSVFGLVRERFVGDGQCVAASESLMCRLNNLWQSGDPSVFKRFSI